MAPPIPIRYRCGVPFPSLGRFGNRANADAAAGRHRGAPEQPASDTDENAPDHELESYLAALAPETAPETTDTGRRFGDAQVLQLRLNLIANDELKQLALARQTSPQALAQEWILERLSWEAQEAEQERRHTARQDGWSTPAPTPPAPPQTYAPAPHAPAPAPGPARGRHEAW